MPAASPELYQSLLAITTGAEPEQGVERFLHLVLSATGAHCAFLHLWDEEVQEYLLLQIVCPQSEPRTLRRQVQQFLRQVQQQQRFPEHYVVDTLVLDACSYTGVVLPLHAAGQAVGLLGLGQTASQVAMAVLDAFQPWAVLMVAAIRQQRHNQELQRQNRELTKIQTRLETTLQAFEHRQATIEALSFTFAGDAIVTVDTRGQISSWNKGAERVYGHTREEAVGQPLRLLYASPAIDAEAYARIFPGHVATDMEVVRQTRDGQEIIINLTTSPLMDAAGRIVGGCEISRDVTRQKQLEHQIQQQNKVLITQKDALETTVQRLHETQSQLIHSEKMAAIGVLLAGLSHELNNPLGIILGYTQSLLKRCPEAESHRQALLAIERQAQRCAQLVKSLLDFCRKKPSVKERVAASVVLQRLAELMKGQARRHEIRISSLPADAPIPELNVCLTEMESALLNLVNNALDATAPGGTISLQARAVAHAGQPGLEICVSDTGCGIAAEILPQVFNPFFTTKPVGKGTGLGLSLTQQIVESHGGQIRLDSLPNVGTTVRLWLPEAATVLPTEGTRL